MPSQQYAYQACDTQGTTHKGQLNADSEQEVVSILQSRQLIPVKISLEKADTLSSFSLTTPKASTQDVIDFTNGLCTLVDARVPLDKALSLLEGITEKPVMQNLIAELRYEVKDGRSLADALRSHPETFSHMYINMVNAGEEGGILDKLLPRLAKFMEDASEARRTVISALIYPVLLSIVGIVSVVALLLFVVPQFAVLFEDMGSTIPDSAAFLLALSKWLQSYWWTLFFIPVGIGGGWQYMGSSPERHLQRDAFLLKLPLLGNLLLEAESSRFCRTLGALLGAGIPLLKGLHITRGVMENKVLVQHLESVEEEVRSGNSLGKALQGIKIFPILLPQLVIVGEESGRTAQILDKLSESFDVQVRQKTANLVALVEPLLIVGLGGLVGGVVIIMLSAIFSINDMQF